MVEGDISSAAGDCAAAGFMTNRLHAATAPSTDKARVRTRSRRKAASRFFVFIVVSLQGWTGRPLGPLKSAAAVSAGIMPQPPTPVDARLTDEDHTSIGAVAAETPWTRGSKHGAALPVAALPA
jgi:hypothetical protein